MIFGVLDYVKIGAGVAVGFVLASAVSTIIWEPNARREAVAAERAAVLARTAQILKDRNNTDAQISNMDAADLCRALGGVPDKGACN